MQQNTDLIELPNGVTYNKTQVIGHGNYSTVYKGFYPAAREPVAVKIVNLAKFYHIKDALENEINILKQLKENPNIMKLYDCFTSHPYLVIVTEFCNSGDLKVFLQNNKSIPETNAKNFLRQTINALKSLHDIGIMHRDLKPANILLHKAEGAGSFNLKLADFGFSKQFLNPTKLSSEMVNTIVGTPLYMSPQILRGEQYTSKSDIWSLGIIYYQMLYGETPWKGSSPSIYLNNVMSSTLFFPDTVEVSELSKDFIKRCLVKEEKLRMGWKELFNTELKSLISPEINKFKTDGSASKEGRNQYTPNGGLFEKRNFSPNVRPFQTLNHANDEREHNSYTLIPKDSQNEINRLEEEKVKLNQLKEKFSSNKKITSALNSIASISTASGNLSEQSQPLTYFNNPSRKLYSSKLMDTNNSSFYDKAQSTNGVQHSRVRLKNDRSAVTTAEQILGGTKVTRANEQIFNTSSDSKTSPFMIHDGIMKKKDSIRSLTPPPIFGKNEHNTSGYQNHNLSINNGEVFDKSSLKQKLKELKQRSANVENTLDCLLINQELFRDQLLGASDYRSIFEILELYINSYLEPRLQDLNLKSSNFPSLIKSQKAHLAKLREVIREEKSQILSEKSSMNISLNNVIKNLEDKIRYFGFDSEEYIEMNELKAYLLAIRTQ